MIREMEARRVGFDGVYGCIASRRETESRAPSRAGRRSILKKSKSALKFPFEKTKKISGTAEKWCETY